MDGLHAASVVDQGSDESLSYVFGDIGHLFRSIPAGLQRPNIYAPLYRAIIRGKISICQSSAVFSGQAELLADWQRLQAGRSPLPIEPLK